ncbi:MAG: Fic family protein [Rhizobiaceae bacterium]|nr:Fic family protein [Rhizobiaceae bacterium]
MSGDEIYCYPPDFNVLRNRFGIRDTAELDHLERGFVARRLRQRLPSGTFDLAHLRAIHRHLFQDIYDWAGEVRTVEISKNGNQFQFRRFIETGMADVHRRIVARYFLRGLKVPEFARQAGEILGDVNYCHPFREGNAQYTTHG